MSLPRTRLALAESELSSQRSLAAALSGGGKAEGSALSAWQPLPPSSSKSTQRHPPQHRTLPGQRGVRVRVHACTCACGCVCTRVCGVRVLCVRRGVCVCACVMRACMLVRVCVRACTVPSVSVSTHASSLQTNVLSPSPTCVHQHLLCADAVGSVGAVLGEATAPASSGGFGVGARAVTGQRVQCHHAAGPGLFLRSPAEACGVLSSDCPGVSAAHGFLWL